MLDMDGKINTVEANFDTLNEADRDQIEANILSVLGEAYQVGALEVNSELLANLQVGQIILNLLRVLAAIIPARQAARLEIVEALRYE